MTLPLEVKSLYCRYPGMEEDLLEGIDLQLQRGEIVAIVGLSGNGKTTLCYCLTGIIPRIYRTDIGGEIRIFGKNLEKMEQREIVTNLGIVFQDPDTQLFSPTVEDEIAFGPENLCLSKEEIGERIDEALKIVGMEAYRSSHPNHLSGGQKQLIALGAVLSLRPEILIFDEAMAQIDEKGKKSIKNMMVNLKKQGKSIIMIEHDLDNLNIADRVMVLKNKKLQPYEGIL